MKPAIAYCRVSTRSQSENGASLQTQETGIRAFAKEQDITIARVFQEVYTGAELYDRPKLNEVRGMVKSGRFGVLICYSIDRLSRDPVHMMILAEECARANVELCFVTERLDDTPEGKLIQYVRGYAGQVEREKIRERSIRGRRAVVLSGRIHGSGVELYGYRRDKGRGVREIYEPEAIIVRRVFDLAIKGHGTRSIAAMLNKENVPSPSVGKRALSSRHSHHWAHSQIKRMLHDESYKGVTIAWKWKSGPKKHSVVPRDPKDHIKLPEGTTPAIVSARDWQSAQEMIVKNRGECKRNETHQYLLRGYLFCADCGQRMYSDPGKGHRIYRCSSRGKITGKCEATTVRADWVEEWVWEEMRTFFTNPTLIVEAHEKSQKSDRKKYLLDQLEGARRQLKRLEGQQQKLIHRFRLNDDDALASVVEKELRRAEDEKQTVLQAIDRLREQVSHQTAATLNHATLVQYCRVFNQSLDGITFDQKRRAFQAFRLRVFASGKPSRVWKMSINPGGEMAQSKWYCDQDAILIPYKRRKKAA